jgi:hypothetical protein
MWDVIVTLMLALSIFGDIALGAVEGKIVAWCFGV